MQLEVEDQSQKAVYSVPCTIDNLTRC